MNAARAEEMDYFHCMRVYVKVPRREAYQELGKPPIKVRWVDTDIMLSDPLTKIMNADRLTQAMKNGWFDLQPTPESLAIKAKNRLLRSGSKAKELSGTEPVD